MVGNKPQGLGFLSDYTLLMDLGFVNNMSATSFFIQKECGSVMFFLVYMDDVIFTGSYIAQHQHFFHSIPSQVSLKDLVSLKIFPGAKVLCIGDDLFWHCFCC